MSEKKEVVWLMPVATDAPQDPSLLRIAWGRSNLSTGQMAHAYQCIVEAARECGQTSEVICGISLDEYFTPCPQQQ